MNKIIVCLVSLLATAGVQAQVNQQILGERHAMMRLDSQKRYLLLPVEEKEESAHIRVVKDNRLVKTFNCRLAVD